MRTVTVAFLVLGASVLACEPSRPSRVPSGAVRVVPADQVKGTCACDDDDDLVADDAPRPRRKPVEYVKLRDWQPPPSVEELEASIAVRGPAPSTYTTFPPLTLHQPIDNRGYRLGTVHAK